MTFYSMASSDRKMTLILFFQLTKLRTICQSRYLKTRHGQLLQKCYTRTLLFLTKKSKLRYITFDV